MTTANYGLFTRLLRQFRSVRFSQKRYRYKKKWAEHRRVKTAPQLALEHFDLYYKPVYGKLWPSIRISLLSPQKYCALVNNFFSRSENALSELKSQGCYDFMKHAKKHDLRSNLKDEICVTDNVFEEQNNQSKIEKSMENPMYHEMGDFPQIQATQSDDTEHFSQKSGSMTNINSGMDKTWDKSEVIPPDLSRGNMYDFVPVQKVYSSKELLKQEEITQSIYEPRDIGVTVIPDEGATIPEHVKACVFPQGDIRDFLSPKPDEADILGYYLMDAASILPVVALNPKPDDHVLDLCAAPGGKTLTLLQTMSIGDVVAVDRSYGRIQRLKDVLRWYSTGAGQKVTTIHGEGTSFSKPMFDKVLVDVPCSTDRHVLTAEDNNLFKPGRITERLELPNVQKSLLIAGIKSCRPGGTVVYSTCTLSPPQNDGVIQAAFEDIWESTRIDVGVQDISWIRAAFCKTFRFFDHGRFGQLVLPTLSANFGPMYVCKIKRMN